jgi:hypothetical protein
MCDKRIENEPYSPSREEERNTESDVKKIDSLNAILLILFFGLLASLSTINKLFFQSTPYPELILIIAECAAILLSFLTVIRAKEWYEKSRGKEAHVQLTRVQEQTDWLIGGNELRQG